MRTKYLLFILLLMMVIGVNSAEILPIASPQGGDAPLTITCMGNYYGAIPINWNWDFGDGSSSNIQNPTHQYSNAGKYEIKLTVNKGLISENSRYVTGLITVWPGASFTASPVSGFSPLTVQFIEASTGNPDYWFWDFGDGSKSNIKNPIHTYNSWGTYTAGLMVVKTLTDGSTIPGCRTKIITFLTPAPIVDFAAFQDLETLRVDFVDYSTNGPTSWNWDFGDGTSSIELGPMHTYKKAGTYQVTLTATNAGGSNTATKIITVTKPTTGPVAAFTTSTNSGVAPLIVQFTDASTGGIPTSWAWTFGDGGTSTVQNPSHQYTTAGTFTAKLIVKNVVGQSTKSRIITVRSSNVPVAPSIKSISPTSGQQGGKATVTITGTNFEKNKVKVSVSGKGVTVGVYKTRNTNKIVVPFTIAKTATTGTRNVTVTNPSSNLNDTKKFTVTAAPKITKISPTSAKQGKTVKLTITGKNFEKGKSTVIISGKGVSVTKYVTRNTDKIVANIKIASSAAATKRTVTIKNPTWGVTATATTKFSVSKAKGTSASEVEPVSSVSNGVLSSPVLSSSSSTSSPKSPIQSGTGLIQVTPPSVV